MLKLFQYNWQVRNEWFELCSQVSKEELLRQHIGGMGSILKTFFHIIDVEYSWIRVIKNEPDIVLDYNDYLDLELIQQLSAEFHAGVKNFVENWTIELEDKATLLSWSNESFTQGEILRHIIAHEIHHIGQLSIWAKELGLNAVSTDFIGRVFK